MALLLTLTSELALLLVACGESEALTVFLVAPDRTLYKEDAGILVIRGLKLPGIVRLISICLIAISRDFFDSVLPKPELSGDEDFPDKWLCGECISSFLGGASFLIFITLSTILVPITTGLTLSFALTCNRFTACTGTELPLFRIIPLGGRPLAGEHDCRLTRPFGAGSMDDDRELGAPGLPLVADGGLSGRVVLKFGGVSRENPGISDGFHGLGLRDGDGELGRDVELFTEVATGLETEEETGDLEETIGVLVPLETVGLRVGVEALNVDFDAGAEDLLGGVEGLAADRPVGVEDLARTVGFVEDNVRPEVGVADLEGFAAGVEVALGATLGAVIEVGLVEEADLGLFDAGIKADLDVVLAVESPVGVAGREPGPPEEDGLRSPPLEVFSPGDLLGCLDKLFLAAVSG